MAVNKVIIDGETKLDLTGDSVTPNVLVKGYSAHNSAGEKIEGTVAVAPASDTTPLEDGDASPGTKGAWARGDHVHPSQMLICKITGNGTTASPYVCDKTTAQIYEAAQAGKHVYVDAGGGVFCPLSLTTTTTARFTVMTSTDTIKGMQGYANLVTVRENGEITVKNTELEQTSNKVDTISASSTVAEYPSANAVWNAIPHPEAKTDAMTQGVGKDADGKLWTAPGGGGGFAPTLVASLVADGTTASIMQNIDIVYPAIYTVSIYAKGIADPDNAGQYIYALFGGKGQFDTGATIRSIKTVNNTYAIQMVALTFALDAEKKIRTIGKADNLADNLTNWDNYVEGTTPEKNAILMYSSTNKIIPAGFKCDVWRWM